MLKPSLRSLGLPTLFAVLLAGSAMSAGGDSPMGLWIDDTGQGAVEIRDCGGKLCGQVVWLKSTRFADRCKLRVIGGLSAAGDGTWGGGWIYDPKSNAKFDVEITPVSNGKLKVLGYAGTKALSRTMTWTKAPDGLKRCDEAPPAVVTAQNEPTATPPVAPGAQARSADAVPPMTPPAPAKLAPGPKARSTSPRHAAAADKPKRHAGTVKLASLGAYGLQDITLRKSRGACSLKVSDFANLAFPC